MEDFSAHQENLPMSVASQCAMCALKVRTTTARAKHDVNDVQLVVLPQPTARFAVTPAHLARYDVYFFSMTEIAIDLLCVSFKRVWARPAAWIVSKVELPTSQAGRVVSLAVQVLDCVENTGASC